MEQNLMMMLPGIQAEELMYLQSLTQDLTDDQKKQFAMLYQGKRKDPQNILLFTLVGFIGIAGVQRFVVDEMGMGIVFFLTAGFCGIGTLVDLVNHKKIASKYNQKQAIEALTMTKMMSK